jgi:hypothetical protein
LRGTGANPSGREFRSGVPAATSNKQQATSNKQQATSNKQQATSSPSLLISLDAMPATSPTITSTVLLRRERALLYFEIEEP